MKTSTKDVLAQDIIDGLRKRIAELKAGSDRTGKHYGLSGTACLYTGQLDAGPCWKCQIKKLEAKLNAAHNWVLHTCHWREYIQFVKALEGEAE